VPKAVQAWRAPVKLRVRGTKPLRTAAAAITLRIRLSTRTSLQSSFRTMAGVFPRTLAIPSAVLMARSSSAACHRHRYNSAISSLVQVVDVSSVVTTSRRRVRTPLRDTRTRRSRPGKRSGIC
jgi:hypothetical protein